MGQQKQVEMEKNQAIALVKFGKAIERLEQNPDFKMVVLDHYFNMYPMTLIPFKSQVGQQNEKDQMYLNGEIEATGRFQNFLSEKKTQARVAGNTLKDIEEEGEK